MLPKTIRRVFYSAVIHLALCTCALFGQSTNTNPTCSQVNGQCDDLPPDLLSVSYPAGVVNVAAENQNPTFLLSAVGLDPLSGTELVPPQPGGKASGVSYAYIEFVNHPCSGPSPSQAGYAWADLYPHAAFVPGQAQTLGGFLSFSSAPPTGSYYACTALIVDNLGNTQQYSLYSGAISSLLAGLPPIQVTGCAICSGPPPVLNGLSITPLAADVTNSPTVVTATLSVTTGNSGLDLYRSEVILYFQGPSQGYSWSSSQSTPYHLALLSGTQNSGTYQAQIKIPQYSPAGSWMAYVSLCDNLGDCQGYQPSQLAALGFSSSATITDALSDTSAPQFKSLSFSEYNSLATTNLVDPDVPITVTLALSDVPLGGGLCQRRWIRWLQRL